MDDIKRCSSLAYQTVSEFGLSSAVGPLSVSSLANGGSDEGALFGRDSGAPICMPTYEGAKQIQSIGGTILAVVNIDLSRAAQLPTVSCGEQGCLFVQVTCQCLLSRLIRSSRQGLCISISM